MLQTLSLARLVQGKKDGVDKLAQAFVTDHPHLSKAEVRRKILEIAERKRHVEGHGTARWVCKESYVATLDSATSSSLSEPVKFTPKKATVKPKVEKVKQQSGPSSSTGAVASVTAEAVIDAFPNNGDADKDKDAPLSSSETSPTKTAVDDEGDAEADVSVDDDCSEDVVSKTFHMDVDDEGAPAKDEQPDNELTAVDPPSPSSPTTPLRLQSVDDSALVASSTPATDATDLAATTAPLTQAESDFKEDVKVYVDEEVNEEGQMEGRSEGMMVVD